MIQKPNRHEHESVCVELVVKVYPIVTVVTKVMGLKFTTEQQHMDGWFKRVECSKDNLVHSEDA